MTTPIYVSEKLEKTNFINYNSYRSSLDKITYKVKIQKKA